MDWSTIIAVSITTLGAFLGGVIAKHIDFKSKKLDITKSHSDEVIKCQEKHKDDISKVRAEFTEKLDVMFGKLEEIQTQQLKTALYITELQTYMNDFKTSLENIAAKQNDLETDVAVLENEVKNIEARR